MLDAAQPEGIEGMPSIGVELRYQDGFILEENESATDFIKKPFDFDELIVRIKAILRKSFDSKNDEINYGELVYKISTNDLIDLSGEVIIVRPQEKKLLQIFFKNMDKTLVKQDLLDELGGDSEASEGALRVYLTKLRKLGLNIVSQKGVGYKLAIVSQYICFYAQWCILLPMAEFKKERCTNPSKTR